MGTRNLVCVMKNGEFRTAQYGQWDGYPTGQGQTIAEFLLHNNLDTFRNQVDKIRVLSADDVRQRWKDAGADDSGWVNMEVSERFKQKNAHLSRDCGALILHHILESGSPEVYMDLDFAADSLFCEYAYIVNLDTNELEVYKGFNQDPNADHGNFSFLKGKSEGEYQPVTLFKKYRFDELTSTTMSELEKEMHGEDEG